MDKNKWIEVNYDLYWSDLYRYAYTILKDRDSASDAVQEVFVSIYNNYDHLHIQQSKSYLLRAVKYKSLSMLSESSFDTVQLESVYKALSDNEMLSDKEAELFRKQLVDIVYKKAKEILPDRCFQVFSLRYYQNYSYREIAKDLGISESTVENQLAKALKILRTNLPYSVDLQVLVVLAFPLVNC
ncbi:sigma-70 family RNA polymerase sigma factor [Myroides pelagicus]|nr:sigma-70 family RNA polymerase sigma factor [Myroides pelagicus]MEC4114868.1 sigma-70 family RNA polymerase sigma factor [Myroides pelagicus]